MTATRGTRRSKRCAEQVSKSSSKSSELRGMVFVMSGRLSKPQAELSKDIQDAGGEVRPSMAHDEVTHLLSNLATSKKIQEAKERNLKVVDEEWLCSTLGLKTGDKEEDDEEQGQTRPVKKAKATKKSQSKSKKAGFSGLAPPDIDDVDGSVDAGVKAIDPKLAKSMQVVTGFDVRLALVEPKLNSDKFYLIQLLANTSNAKRKTYYVFSRWGRTGTSGQGKLVGPYKTRAASETEFKNRFKLKTAYSWEDREDAQTSPKTNKHFYTYLHYDAQIRQQCLDEAATWQYYLQDDPQGKADGWYDYDPSNSDEVEDLFATYEKQGNKAFGKRFITSESSGFTYQVDLQKGTQTNTSSATIRPIRRALPGENLPTGPPKGTAAVAKSKAPPVQASAPVMKSAPSGATVTASTAAQTLAGAVDASAPSHLQHGTIYGEYDAMLNQTDLKRNANKFIKVQLIRTAAGITLHKRWGRVGEAGQQQQIGPMDSDAAEAAFGKYFKSKTGNKWDERDDFEACNGKYTLIEMEANSEEASAQMKSISSTEDTSAKKHGPCSLSSPVKNFVDLIFDEDMFKGAMEKLQIDAKRLPLGALSKAQVKKGRDILVRLQDAIQNNASSSTLEELSGEFYTVVPHAFGRTRPPAINTLDVVGKKFEMLNTLDDIESAQSFMKEAQNADSEQKHPSDINYDALKADIEEITEKNAPDEWKAICQYLKSTCSSYSAAPKKLERVFRVDRHGEEQRFKVHDVVSNRKLLWHGTNVAVVAAILKSGLRIMPHSGGRVGRGIYLADMHEKSFGYTCAGGGKVIMFLVEAALGKECTITRDDPSLTKAPPGYQCVVARGTREPCSEVSIELDEKEVLVPQGKPKPSKNKSSSFHHNEFLIYDESQHRIRYVLQFSC